MSLRKANGNMYPWVTHMHSHLAGRCPHQCSYCYVTRGRAKNSPKYQGDLRLIEEELDVIYGKNKTIFIEHCNDMYANEVEINHIWHILHHCREYPDNIYVFQTKNPSKALPWLTHLPRLTFFGVTIETNRPISISKAPQPMARLAEFKEIARRLQRQDQKSFITIEPILAMDPLDFACRIINNGPPDFVNIGADSKHNNLEEPTLLEIEQLINALKIAGIEVREKRNLARLRPF